MKRSKFNLSSYKLFSGRQGYLYPCQLMEVLPGDVIQGSTSLFIRMSPLVTPVMHPVHVKIHHWFVPTRLIWEKWEDFITGGPDGMDTSVPPYLTLTTSASGSLHDYLGVPSGNYANPMKISALPFRAYNLIYNEWYRDQDLEPELTLSKTSGSDTTTSLALQLSSWENDYLTTARPWPQKGPQVTIPVFPATGGTGDDYTLYNRGSTPGVSIRGMTNRGMSGGTFFNRNGSDTAVFVDVPTTGTADPGNLYLPITDLSDKVGIQRVPGADPSVGEIDINAFREAMAIQRFEEHRALHGSRYVEYLKSAFGVRAQDSRLQRPEYLGGGKQTIQFSEVLQTAEGDDPVGTMRGHGIGAMKSNRFRRFIPEHGFIMSLMTIRPIAIYEDGLHRLWTRQTKEDYFQHELQRIGQQPVLNKEVYAMGPGPDNIFGYQNRYDEYRYQPNMVAGEFRNVLEDWHMARKFTSEPALNSSFVSGLPTNRIYASTDTDQFYVMANHSTIARRALPKDGTPI